MMLIFLIVLFSRHCSCIFPKNFIEDKINVCQTNFETSTNIWMIYKTHLTRINSLTIILLQDKINQEIIRDFAKITINKMFLVHKSFKVQENYLFQERYTILSQHLNIRKGFFIICWSLDILRNYLLTDYRIVVPNQRARYIILILDLKCQHYQNILKYFWNEFNVANIIIHTLCACDKKIYFYYPFKCVKKKCGLSTRYSVNEVLHNSSLIISSIRNFNRFPLNISVFIFEPMMIRKIPKFLQANILYSKIIQDINLAGLDAFILATMAEKLNFEPIIIEHRDKEPFGRVLVNGTIIGTLGEVVKRKVHLSSNGRFVKDYNTKKVEFLVPYINDQICMVVPKASTIPKWKTLFTCFKATVWLLVVISSFIFTVFWNFLNKKKNIRTTTWQSFSFLVGIPVQVNPNFAQIIFLSVGFFFSLVILGTIQGSFFTKFTTVSFYKDIDTLSELYESGLSIATNYWFLVEDDKSEIMIKLKKRLNPAAGNALDMVANLGSVATIARKQEIDIYIKTRTKNDNRIPAVHIVNECFTTALLANIVPRGSPFLEAFNNVILSLFESGFTSKWYKDVINSYELEEEVKLGKIDTISAVTLYEIQVAFLILFYGHAISTIAFIIELFNKNKSF